MLDTVLDHEPNQLTDADLIALLQSTHVDSTRYFAAFIVSLAEFDQRGLAVKAGASSTLAWLDRALGIARSTAYGYLHTSRTLARFAMLATAFLAGELSYSKVRLLERHLTEDNEHELVALAMSLSYSDLKLALAGQGQDHPPTPDRLRIWTDENGNCRIEGVLSPELGAQLAAAIKIGELASMRDLAEVDAQESTVTRFGPATDALTGFIGMINLARTATSSPQRAPGAEVHMVVTEDGHAFLPANPAAPAAALTGLLADASFRGLLLDSKGVALKMGRRRRLVSGGQELALMISWMFRCATPGCPHTRFLQFHHITAWARGGLTDCENLLPLCSRCHSMVSTGELRIAHHPTDTHQLVFTFADGARYVSINRGLPRRTGCAAPPEAEPPLRRGEWDDDPSVSFGEESTRVDCLGAGPT